MASPSQGIDAVAGALAVVLAATIVIIASQLMPEVADLIIGGVIGAGIIAYWLFTAGQH
jgi:hypothetical protein